MMLKRTFLLCTLLIAGLTQTFATTVTYTISDKNTLTVSGTAPIGSSATLAETYSTSKKMTAGHSQTLTLKGFDGCTVTNITLSMKSNTSGGAGTFTLTNDGISQTLCSGGFQTNSWYGKYSTSYVPVSKDISLVCGETIYLQIAATANSLYCESYTLTYEPVATAPVEEYTITWSVNGDETVTFVQTGERPIYNDGTDPGATYSKVFVGWITSAIESSTNEAPALLSSAEIPAASANATYYAVFATKTVTEGVEGWNKTEIDDITPTDVVVITSFKGEYYYAISNNNGTSASPTAIAVMVSENKITSTVTDNIKWNISNDDGKLTIYPDGTTEKWLYCTSSNEGVRVGTNKNKEFTIATSGHLKHIATSRYIGVYYVTPDFRCYTNTSGYIAGQTLVFFKYGSGTTTYSAYVTTIPTSENPTALENAAANEVKAVKVIENGQLVIVKDGVRYNVLGTVIK